jgi:hypothetical protein
VAVPAGHVLVGDERVGHGFLGGLDDRREERVDLVPGDEFQVTVGGAGLRGFGVLRVLGVLRALRILRGEGTSVGGGDGQEDRR